MDTIAKLLDHVVSTLQSRDQKAIDLMYERVLNHFEIVGLMHENKLITADEYFLYARAISCMTTMVDRYERGISWVPTLTYIKAILNIDKI